jgi:hypothetical protein
MAGLAARSDQLELGLDVYRAPDAARHGTRTVVNRVRALGLRALVPGDPDPVVDADPLEDQHAVLVLDLAAGLDVVPILPNFDLTRFQRAGKGAGQSAGGRGDHVVERGRLGREPLRVGAVVLGTSECTPKRTGSSAAGR